MPSIPLRRRQRIGRQSSGSPEIMRRWLDNDGEPSWLSAPATRRLGRPRAAYDVAEQVWAAAVRGPYPSPDGKNLPGLTSLLNLFHLPH
ncbi:hypothetical protein [Candidatus Amarobacter glycogenicus]|uniref:hypothetical protein n=1 Tax=Candidatus Amarobacter glycogenicus TaxID=3140699 RepID=UPI002A163106|nr:hypothetical protein [Dehalococcoidia bacterium]